MSDNTKLIAGARMYSGLPKPETYKETVDSLASAKHQLDRLATALEAAEQRNTELEAELALCDGIAADLMACVTERDGFATAIEQAKAALDGPWIHMLKMRDILDSTDTGAVLAERDAANERKGWNAATKVVEFEGTKVFAHQVIEFEYREEPKR